MSTKNRESIPRGRADAEFQMKIQSQADPDAATCLRVCRPVHTQTQAHISGDLTQFLFSPQDLVGRHPSKILHAFPERYRVL